MDADDLAGSGLPAGSTVASVELPVTVVPAPPVELELTFDLPTLTVAAGATATAELSLAGVPADAAVTVTLSSADTATARVMPESVTFTAQTPSTEVTVTGEAAGMTTVTAIADALTDSGLPLNSTVASVELPVTVEPAPVMLQLAFSPSALTVAVGSEETAVLSLLGVPAGAEVTVSLSAADATTARLVTEPELRFSAATTSHVVTVAGVAEGSATVTAAVFNSDDLPADSTVASAELVVTLCRRRSRLSCSWCLLRRR